MDDPTLLDIFDAAATRVQQGDAVRNSMDGVPLETAQALQPELEMVAQVATLPQFQLSAQAKDALATRLIAQMAEKKKAIAASDLSGEGALGAIPVIGIERALNPQPNESHPPTRLAPARPSLRLVAFWRTRRVAAVLAAIALTIVAAGIAAATYATIQAINSPSTQPTATPVSATATVPLATFTAGGTVLAPTSSVIENTPTVLATQSGVTQPDLQTAQTILTGTQTGANPTATTTPAAQPSAVPTLTPPVAGETPVPTQTQPLPTAQPPLSPAPTKTRPTATPAPSLPVPTATVPPIQTWPITIPPIPTLPITIPPLPTLPITIPPLPTITVPPMPTLPITIPPLPTLPVTVPPLPTITVPPLPTLPLSIHNNAAPNKKFTRYN